jgi:eukaryotic-like serine/threonine-protein kinase
VVPEVKSFASFRLDTADHCLWRDDERVSMTPKAYDVLRYLVEHPGRLVTPDELLAAIWTDTYVNPEVLRKYILEIRKALGDKPGQPQFVETVPKRGYRFIAPVGEESPVAPSQPAEAISSSTTKAGVPPAAPDDRELEAPANTIATPWTRSGTAWRIGALLMAIILAAFIVGTYRHPARAGGLTNRDTVVLAEFANTTGDSVFDETLRQGLAAQLEQSPFLSMLSDRRIAETLSLMTKPKDTRLSADLAREVCQRTTSTATIEGSIASLGRNYVIGLRALDCNNGEVLAEEQMTAASKEQVIVALGGAATKLRARLGESLASVQRYDTPAQSVTTPSLEALQAYSAAVRAMTVTNDSPTTIRLLERAVELDPDFAAAYELSSNASWSQGEIQRAAESMTKAYALRTRVSERERLSIDATYEWIVNGDLESARKAVEIWSATYPRDSVALTDMGILSTNLGDYNRSLAALKDAQKIDPDGQSYSNLVAAYTNVNRLVDARQTAQQALAHGFDTPFLRQGIYWIDFLENNPAAMKREVSSQTGQAGAEDMFLFAESDTAAYSGQFGKAQELTRRAVELAAHADEKEVAAGYQAQAAVREALAGNLRAAQQQAQSALAQSKGKDVEGMSAVALASSGDSVRAKRLAADLSTRYPKDTIVRSIYLPLINAATHLHTGDGNKAVDALAPSACCELGSGFANGNFDLYPPYFRGVAFLMVHNSDAAAAEFQKIVDHSGVVVNEEIGALAHLGLGRAYALAGDKGKAKAAYNDFLSRWRDADAGIPILEQARAEYQKLQ